MGRAGLSQGHNSENKMETRDPSDLSDLKENGRQENIMLPLQRLVRIMDRNFEK